MQLFYYLVLSAPPGRPANGKWVPGLETVHQKVEINHGVDPKAKHQVELQKTLSEHKSAEAAKFKAASDRRQREIDRINLDFKNVKAITLTAMKKKNKPMLEMQKQVLGRLGKQGLEVGIKLPTFEEVTTKKKGLFG